MWSHLLLTILATSLVRVNAAPAPDRRAASTTQVKATTTLTSIAQASDVLVAIYSNETTRKEYPIAYIEEGLTTLSLKEVEAIVAAPLKGPDSDTNHHSTKIHPSVYPKASSKDAPYDLSESDLKKAIYIPSSFQCGKNGQPVILVPGTGDTGYTSFIGNYIPLLQNSSFADPVWLNIPGFLLDGIQTSAEYVAYAVNYIHVICSTKVAVLAWSQGNIDAQWAYKYWPSTRKVVTDHIALSPDYHGTNMSLPTSKTPMPPASLQQAYNSTFIKTLRAGGGDAAYVPTTTIYSATDQIVEPQQGTTASAYLLNSTSAAASNNEVQAVCPGQPAGSLYTHEGMLYNPLGYALLQDALANDGPGDVSRLDLGTVCASYVTPGLTLTDLQRTEDAITFFVVSTQAYPKPVHKEPKIKGYAQK